MRILFSLCLIVLLLVMTFTVFAMLILALDSLRRGPPFVPTRKRVIDSIIKAMNLGEHSYFFDLGCGDGRILMAAINQIPTLTGIGIEKRILPYFMSKFHLHGTAAIIFGDFFKVDLSRATHIYCYLSQEAMKQLESKVLSECQRGTRIISCDFQFPHLIHKDQIDISKHDANLARSLFIYER